MMLVQLLMCASFAVVIFKDFKRLLQSALQGVEWKSSGCTKANSDSSIVESVLHWRSRLFRASPWPLASPYVSSHGQNDAARLTACRDGVGALRELRAQLAGSSQQRASLQILARAGGLLAMLHPNDDKELRRALYEAVEPALQRLDISDSCSRLAAEHFLNTLRSYDGVLLDWQTAHLHMVYDTALEVDALMTKSARDHYASLPIVRAEQLGDHTIANIETVLDAEYDAMHDEARHEGKVD